MGVNGKQKGNRWEREVADYFSEHFGGKFKRTPMSGAIVGGLNRKLIGEGLRSDAVEILAGDVITPKDFPFSIECKSYKDFLFHQLLSGENKTLDKWIAQSNDDAKVSKKVPLLVMKFVRKGEYVCTGNFRVGDTTLINKLDNCIKYKKDYLIYTLGDFFKIIKETEFFA